MTEGFLKDLTKYLPSQIVPGLIAFIAIPVLTRLFSPEHYGNYVLVIAAVNIFVTIVGWLTLSTIRFYPAYDKDNKLDIFYGTVLKLTFISIGILGGLYLVLLLLFKNHFTPKLYFLMQIGTFLFILQSLFGVLQYLLRAKYKVNWYSGFVVWRSTAALCLGLFFVIVLRQGVEGLLFGSLLGISLALPLLWKISINVLPWQAQATSMSLTIEMAKYGFPLVAGNLAAWILRLSDRYILEFLVGSNAVGIYAASYGIAEGSIVFVSTLFMLTSGPIGMNIWEQDSVKASQDFITKVVRYFLLVCFPAVIGLSILANPIVSLLTAKEYHEGSTIIPFVAFGVFFLGLQQNFQKGLLYYKKTHFIMFGTIISGLLNIVLNFLLIPRYGYIAAAATTLISYSFLLVLMIVFSRRFFVWPFPFKTLWRAICASAIMGVAVYYIYQCLPFSIMLNLFLGVFTGIVLYVFLLFLLREFDLRMICYRLAKKANSYFYGGTNEST